MFRHPISTNSMWIEGTLLKQMVYGPDWIVDIEGILVEKGSEVVKFKRNFFGVSKPYKESKFIIGRLEPTEGGLQYVDQNGDLRMITKECKPKVTVSKLPSSVITS